MIGTSAVYKLGINKIWLSGRREKWQLDRWTPLVESSPSFSKKPEKSQERTNTGHVKGLS